MKRVLSLILAVLVMTSAFMLSTNASQVKLSVKEALAQYEAQTGEEVDTNRYYFLMPNGSNGEKNPYMNTENYDQYPVSWYNEYASEPAVIWWGVGDYDPQSFSGYTLEKGDAQNVYYADIPKQVYQLRWNNNVEVTDDDETSYDYLMQTIIVSAEYYDTGESVNYPDGIDSFDNMIYVVHAPTSDTDMIPSSSNEFIGEWYYYYGDGCYGTVEDGTVDDCIRDDHLDMCGHHRKNSSLFEDRFLEVYQTEYDHIGDYHHYEELFYHYDGDNEVDWALIEQCSYNNPPWNYHRIYKDRILMYGDFNPFTFRYGVYNVAEDEFYDIFGKGFEFSKYEGLEEFFGTLDVGRPIGDADNDNDLSILDATHIQMALAKLIDFDSEDDLSRHHFAGESLKFISDFDRDGDRTVLDATAIQRKLAALDDKKPVENEELVMYSTDEYFRYYSAEHMPSDVTEVEFSEKLNYSEGIGIKTCYVDSGEGYTLSIIKSKEQYNEMYNTHADSFSDEFFDDYYVVAATTLGSCGQAKQPISRLAIKDNILYVVADEYTDSELVTCVITYYTSMVAVEKELLKDVTGIQRVTEYSEDKPDNNEMLLVYEQEYRYDMLPVMPSGAMAIKYDFLHYYEKYTGCTTNNIDYYDNSYLIIKSKEQYDDIMTIYNDEFDEAFFEDKYLFISIGHSTFMGRQGPAQELRIKDNTLYFYANKYYSTSEFELPIEYFFASIIAVDKNLLKNVDNIVRVSEIYY